MPSAISARPLRTTEIDARAFRQLEPGDALARRGRVRVDLNLDQLEALAAKLEQPDEPVLGHLVLDEARGCPGWRTRSA